MEKKLTEELEDLSIALNNLNQTFLLPPQKKSSPIEYKIENETLICINSTCIHLIQGDITKLRSKNQIQVNAIVNAANAQLIRGSGVCGAIFTATQGSDKNDLLTQYIKNNFPMGIQPGQAIITPSYALEESESVKHIIHAVGPIYATYQDKTKAAQILKDAYLNSLIQAENNNLESIAFPFIGTAIYAYPKKEAAQIALAAVKEYAIQHPDTTISNVFFVLFLSKDFDILKIELQKIIKELKQKA